MLNSVNLSILMTHVSRPKIVRNSMVEALACYLNQSGGLTSLMNDPVDATKYEVVMKKDAYKFDSKPLSLSYIGVQGLAVLVENIKFPENKFALIWFSENPSSALNDNVDGLNPLPGHAR